MVLRAWDQMIYLCLIRRCHCEVCDLFFDIEGDDRAPAACPICGSTEWMYGAEEIESRRIRMQIKRAKVTLNPGARSLKRQLQGKRQYQAFRTKEEVDARRQASDN